MATAPLITKLSFPAVIDVSNGTTRQNFSVELTPGALGADVHVQMTFDYIAFGLRLAEDGETNDGFGDATPYYGSSGYDFFGGYPAGNYTIRALSVWDGAGHGARYSAADLKAMNLPFSFTVIDRGAPAAPTMTIEAAASGLIDGARATVSGVGGAYQEISVSYLDEVGNIGTLGTATANAQGHWSLTSEQLSDGHYTQLVATATATGTGKVSTYSAPLSFYVQQAPLAPMLKIAQGTDGAVDAAAPLIWGLSGANDSVTLYDGGKAIATVKADADGWWGVQSGKLSGGTHQFTASAADQFGRVSTLSAAVEAHAAATPAQGISYTVGSFSNSTTQALDLGKLQAVLDAVGALTSSVIDGTQDIKLSVKVQDLGDDNVVARAGSDFHRASDTHSMPTLTDARLSLSADFAKAINDAPSLTSFEVVILAHEMLHVLGFQSDPTSLFQARTHMVGNDAYFFGNNARAFNGGDVALSSDHAHVAAPFDLIAPSYQRAMPYFGPYDAAAPYSSLDLAILKDLGYQNKDTIISDNGHRYLSGNGHAGHDAINGTAGRDTLYVDAKSAEYAVKASAGGYTATDKSGYDGALQISAIERIYFNDQAMALDVGANQIGGMAYRMYQAAFNRAPDSTGLGYWIDKMDQGTSLKAVAHEFTTSAEFLTLYGSQISDAAYVTQLYANVLHRAPDQGGLDFWTGAMKGAGAREEVLVQFSESPENIAQLVGTIHDGFTYTYAVG